MLKPTKSRPVELVNQYEALLEAHLRELRAGDAERTLEIGDFAKRLFVHPRHLSNTLQDVLGLSPCDIYEQKLLQLSKDMLLESASSVAEIARRLHYDPSNFNKFFKAYTGMTPGHFRRTHLNS